jgi:anti-anti-sigma regulatory factor
MSYGLVSEKGVQTMDCGEVMDISTTAELRAQLLTALESGQPVVLDAGRVERIDTAALQVLSAFFQDANSQQQTVQWKNPSQAISSSAELLGLSSLLEVSMNRGE